MAPPFPGVFGGPRTRLRIERMELLQRSPPRGRPSVEELRRSALLAHFLRRPPPLPQLSLVELLLRPSLLLLLLGEVLLLQWLAPLLLLLLHSAFLLLLFLFL